MSTERTITSLFNPGDDAPPPYGSLSAEIEMLCRAGLAAQLAVRRGDPLPRIADYLGDATKWARLATETCHSDEATRAQAGRLRPQMPPATLLGKDPGK